MSRISKFMLILVLAAATLACGLITNPINQAQGLASTAEAMASAMPVQTLQAMGSAVPDVSGMFSPTGQPVKAWNGIPVMPQATVGQEFSAHSYSYKVPLAAGDIQTYYDTQMKALGWQAQFGLQLTGQGGVMAFQKGSSFVTITVTADSSSGTGSVVILQQ